MLLGQITVRPEYINRPKWIFARPVAGPNNLIFPAEIGTCHVVYIERGLLTEGINTERDFTFYGIFDKIPSESLWNVGYINSKITPITREIFENLLQLYPEQNHILMPH